MNRRAEIRDLLKLSPAQVQERAGDRLRVCEDLDALHELFARDLAEELRAAAGRRLRLIVPVGPVGQYPVLVRTVRREGLSLRNTTLFFMDEYADERGRALSDTHPLSLRGGARRSFLDRLDPALAPEPDRVVFPDEHGIDGLAEQVAAEGGIDACYGGIGIHGHVAFNEPEPGVRDSGPRCVPLNDFTITMNAIRAGVGGNLEGFPRHAYTLGMRQILDARRIRLYCRNGCELDWANTVLRLALFGEPGDDYPVTHIRGTDYVITTDRATLAQPAHAI